MMMIQAYPFRNCTHVILDLPWDTMEDVVETAKIISALPTHEIKLHALYIIKNTVMADWYKTGEIQLISAEEYVDRVVTFLEYTRPDIVFQRLIGRAPKEATEFANWGMGWWKIRDMIELSSCGATPVKERNARTSRKSRAEFTRLLTKGT